MDADVLRAGFLDETIAATAARIDELRAEVEIESRVMASLRFRRNAIGAVDKPASQVFGERAIPDCSPQSIPILIDRAMREAGESLSLAELTERVKALGGSTTAAKGMPAIISSSLYRSKDKYVRVGIGRYRLAEQQDRKNASGG